MAHQITLTLSDDEYAAIAKEAAASGQSVEAVLHEVASAHFASRPVAAPPTPPIGEDELEGYLYRIGFTSNLPTHEPDTPKDEAEAERLAELFGQGKPVSEMIIEDRGPY